jgi:peroxiredoxin
MAVLAYLVISLLTVEIVVLITQNRELKAKLNGSSDLVSPFEPGEKVDPFQVYLLSGAIQKIEYDSTQKRQLLFILSTTCPHCLKNLTAWNDITEKSKSNDINIMGISIDRYDQTKKYFEDKDVRFYLSALADSTFSQKYRISGVPVTMLIQGNGAVEKIWLGELSPSQSDEIIGLVKAPRSLN